MKRTRDYNGKRDVAQLSISISSLHVMVGLSSSISLSLSHSLTEIDQSESKG